MFCSAAGAEGLLVGQSVMRLGQTSQSKPSWVNLWPGGAVGVLSTVRTLQQTVGLVTRCKNLP